MSRAPKILLVASILAGAACSKTSTDLRGRPCDDANGCLDGYDCDTLTRICVTQGDPCDAAGRTLPCAGEEVRLCAHGFWSGCRSPHFGNECTPATTICNADDELIICDADGYVERWLDCSVTGCNDEVSPPRCNDCIPGRSGCSDNHHIVCDLDGSVLSDEDCATGNTCSAAGVCDDESGCEVLDRAPNGTPCDEGDGADGDWCNSACDDGVCNDSSNPTCEDAHECTADSCETLFGCAFVNKPAGTPCFGANTSGCDSACDDSGLCDDQSLPDCADGIACTEDNCVAGACENPSGYAGTVCRAAAHDCDVAESCTGLSADCPADGMASAGTECGSDLDNTCTDPDTCDAGGYCLGNHAALGLPCGKQDECDVGDTCDGDGDCSDRGFLPPNTPCGDDTDNDCTDPDTCDGAGDCAPRHATNGDSCDDLDACNAGESCQEGVCAGGAAPVCFEGDTCRAADACDPSGSEGNCEDLGTPINENDPCDDDDPCQVDTRCSTGLCGGGSAVDCSGTATECRSARACSPAGAEGNCATPGTPILEGQACDVANVCTDGMTCQSGSCTGGTTQSCAATSECRNENSCDPAGSSMNCDISGAATNDGAPCTDCGYLGCTTCLGGSCHASHCDGTIDAAPCSSSGICGTAQRCVSESDDCLAVACVDLNGRGIEHHACADDMTGGTWGTGNPCVSANCDQENPLGSGSGQAEAVGQHCWSGARYNSQTTTMRYTFTTSSPSGTQFNLWMRNAVDGSWDTSGERYTCTVDGVNGGTTHTFYFEESDLNGDDRHGTGCGTYNTVSRYCWMAADGDANDVTYDPITFDQGEHLLVCTITLTHNDGWADAGFDGIIFTTDLNYVPVEDDGPVACSDSDADFTDGACGNNWDPYRCSDVEVVTNGSACTLGGGDTCCGGDCINGSCL